MANLIPYIDNEPVIEAFFPTANKKKSRISRTSFFWKYQKREVKSPTRRRRKNFKVFYGDCRRDGYEVLVGSHGETVFIPYYPEREETDLPGASNNLENGGDNNQENGGAPNQENMVAPYQEDMATNNLENVGANNQANAGASDRETAGAYDQAIAGTSDHENAGFYDQENVGGYERESAGTHAEDNAGSSDHENVQTYDQDNDQENVGYDQENPGAYDLEIDGANNGVGTFSGFGDTIAEIPVDNDLDPTSQATAEYSGVYSELFGQSSMENTEIANSDEPSTGTSYEFIEDSAKEMAEENAKPSADSSNDPIDWNKIQSTEPIDWDKAGSSTEGSTENTKTETPAGTSSEAAGSSEEPADEGPAPLTITEAAILAAAARDPSAPVTRSGRTPEEAAIELQRMLREFQRGLSADTNGFLVFLKYTLQSRLDEIPSDSEDSDEDGDSEGDENAPMEEYPRPPRGARKPFAELKRNNKIMKPKRNSR